MDFIFLNYGKTGSPTHQTQKKYVSTNKQLTLSCASVILCIIIDCDVALLQQCLDNFQGLNVPQPVHASFLLLSTISSLSRASCFPVQTNFALECCVVQNIKILCGLLHPNCRFS